MKTEGKGKQARKPNPSVADLRQVLHIMLNEANNWYGASKRCFADGPYSPDIHQSLTYQAIVANAFSIELYIKALLIVSGAVPSYGHDYYEHFQLLPQVVRDKANARYVNYSPGQNDALAEYLKITGK